MKDLPKKTSALTKAKKEIKELKAKNRVLEAAYERVHTEIIDAQDQVCCSKCGCTELLCGHNKKC